MRNTLEDALQVRGRSTNLDCWPSSASAAPSVCVLTEDSQTTGWMPGTSCSQPPSSPSSYLVHLSLQNNQKVKDFRGHFQNKYDKS